MNLNCFCLQEGYLTDEERHQRDYFSMLAPDVSVTHDRHSHRSDMERRSYRKCLVLSTCIVLCNLVVLCL